MVDGLIIPRTYNDYFSRSDPAAIRQLVAQFTDAALSATSENPVQNKVVKAALDVINAVIPTGASANDKLALESSVDAIDAKIPTQASAQNQLADKDFVNSSIGTNTANYISDNGEPFTSVAALEAYSGTVTNNDYAFVTGTDAAGNVYYDRYKATVSGANVSWAKEYRLNNSSFTAAQWAAISSGITAAKVAQYDAGVTPVDIVEDDNMHAVTSNAVAESLSYSTEEHFTGRYWHNGKKIYEKTYNLTNIITDGRSYTFDVSSLHIDEVTKYEGYINRTVQISGDLIVIQYDWNFYDVNNFWGCLFRQKTSSQDVVLYRANISDSITTTGVISLYYTKTTD